MSHSKSTKNYGLPIFDKYDRPAWLTDFNSAMTEVDTVMGEFAKTIDPDALSEALEKATEADTKATAAASDAAEAKTLAEGAVPKSGGTMSGTLDMDTHAIQNVQEISVASGNGLYIGSVIEPSGTPGVRMTGTSAGQVAFVKPDSQSTYVAANVGTPTAQNHATTKKYVDAADDKKLDIAGGTMTGSLILAAAPTEDFEAATKKYVDDHAGSGGGVSKEYVDGQIATCVPLAGGTMTGELVLSSDTPTVGEAATSKNYVLGVFGSCVAKSGGTMTGALFLSGDPTQNTQAATKKYVDDQIAANITAAINASY